METSSPSSVKSQSETELQALRDLVTVVIPTLNEESAIGPLISEIQSKGYNKILVVDGYSKDQTVRIAGEYGAKVVGQHGKGKAGAILVARDLVDTPYFLLMDGDYTYDPADIDRFVTHVNSYDHIIGYRPKKSPNIRKLHRLGNFVLTRAFNIMMGSNVPDVACGMYLMRTEKMRELTLDVHGFSIDQEIAAQMLIDDRVAYVPINYRRRLGKVKSTTWRQGFSALLTIIDLGRRFNPVLLFSFLAGSALVPAVLLLGYASVLYLLFHEYHSGYFLGGIVLLILGAQGMTVATIGTMLRRIERKLSNRTR
ncbi:MAG: glycosyltransferase family 2 protein [Nitrososphaerales archaeon]